jgi:hypothetical protein
MDIQKQVAYFKGLPYQIKKEKLVDMLNQLKDTHKMFSLLYVALMQNETIAEQTLVTIYQGIFEVAAEIEIGNKVQAEDKIKKMGEVLISIRKKEEMEMLREWNPDDMLKDL